MYSTCLFCNKPLGRNESVEAFPVGERLAFDAARGRLWVICRACERWNLSPLEERWEAIEQAEKLFRDTRRRVSTDNIGLAKLPEGTTLVRIGEPQRPEFAAWRYGDQFGRRRNRQLLMATGGVAAVGAVTVGGAVAGVTLGAFGWVIGQAVSSIIYGRMDEVVAKVRTPSRGLVEVRRRHLAESTFDRGDDGAMRLFLRFKNGSELVEGEEAARLAAIVVPKVNRFGGKKKEIAAAVAAIEQDGGSDRFLQRMARVAPVVTRPFVPEQRMGKKRISNAGEMVKHGLFAMPVAQRLALEMALHEEAERRAMEGELTLLEEAWRDAEEIAGISDTLLLPGSVEDAYRKLKDGGGRSGPP